MAVTVELEQRVPASNLASIIGDKSIQASVLGS